MSELQQVFNFNLHLKPSMVKEACRNVISASSQGGASGLALKYMRQTCGLKAVDPNIVNKDELLGVRITVSQDDDLDADAQQLPIFSRAVVVELLNQQQENFKKSHFLR